MHKALFVFSIMMILASLSCEPTRSSQLPEPISLETWHLQSSANISTPDEQISSPDFAPTDWYDIRVPSTVLAALVEHGVYPDPYYGLNLKSIPGFREGRWMAMPKESPFYPSWWYRTEFRLSDSYKNKHLLLHLDGINYQANVWLNGTLLADSSRVKGMFQRFEFDIGPYVTFGDQNVLAIEIIAPGHIPDIDYRTKQVEATTGWDDHNPQPPDLNMGIWRPVSISAQGGVMLKHPYVSTDVALPELDRAELEVSVQLLNTSDQAVTGTLTGRIREIDFSQEVSLSPNQTTIVHFSPDDFTQLVFDEPELWWPHPVGPQNLYDLDLEFHIDGELSDTQHTRFGIRTVSTYIDDNGWRGYKVNGKKILIRGGAWMTSDMLLNLTQERYEALVRYARHAHLNMLRSEGFSIRETETFYDLCDEYGVMVTQQIFGRSIPDEELAIANVRDMLLRIRNHPSLIHFLGHDETFPTENLDQAYRDMIAEYTPERTYQPHSGAFDIEDRFETGGTRTGTGELWCYATPSHYYTHKKDGAWGFAQSGGIGGVIAPYTSVKRMMPKDALWPIDNETFSFHTVLQGVHYFDQVIASLETRYGKPESIQEFCQKGQAMNYASARGMYEAYGRNKFDALGITTWKYDSAWPAALTWQYVDWNLDVGGAYYGAKKACEPLHIQYAYDDSSVWVINNFYTPAKNLTAKARVIDWDMGVKWQQQRSLDVEENGKILAFPISFPNDLSTTHFLKLELMDATDNLVSENFYWLSASPDIEGETHFERFENAGMTWHKFISTPKSVADFTALNSLPRIKVDKEITIDDQVVTVTLSNPTDHLAFMMSLDLVQGPDHDPVLPVYWEDNYISLLPGEKRTIGGEFPAEIAADEIKVLIQGWNCR